MTDHQATRPVKRASTQASKRPKQSYLAQITDLDALVELAYDVFRFYSPHHPLAVCTTCCMSEKNVSTIYKTPLRDLSRDVVYDYLDAAIVSDTQVSAEIRYFIPRIFELMIKGDSLRYSTELTLDKCYLTLGIWSADEIAIFTRFCCLYFKRYLTKFDDHQFRWLEILDTLVMFYLAGLQDMHIFFDIILDSLDNDVALINLCAEFYYHFDYEHYTNPHAPPSLNTLTSDWLVQASTRKRIVNQLMVLSQKPIYQTLSHEQRYWLDLAFDWLS